MKYIYMYIYSPLFRYALSQLAKWTRALKSPNLSFSCLVLSCLIVSSFCWSITWTYYRTDRTSKHNLVPSGLGLRPVRMLILVSFFSFFHFVSVSFLFSPFLAPFFALLSSFSGVIIRMYHGCVPGAISLQVIRNTGWYATALYSTVPFAYWYCGARIILFSSIETLFVACVSVSYTHLTLPTICSV